MSQQLIETLALEPVIPRRKYLNNLHTKFKINSPKRKVDQQAKVNYTKQYNNIIPRKQPYRYPRSQNAKYKINPSILD